jgi:hypothetical protein
MKRALEIFDEAAVTAWFIIAAMLALILMFGSRIVR